MITNVTVATIRDLGKRDVANVQALREGEDLAVRIHVHDATWQKSLEKLGCGNLRFMIDGAVYLERLNADGKEFLALDELVEELSNHELHLEYDSAGVERGHELKRQIAKLQDHYVPFTDLLDILRRSVHVS